MIKVFSIAITLLFVSVASLDITEYQSTKGPFVFNVNNFDNKYFVVRVYIGSNHQSSSYFLLDFATSGIYVTAESIRNFDGRGVFDPSDSDTYKKIGADDEIDVITVNNGETHILKGWNAEDQFGI